MSQIASQIARTHRVDFLADARNTPSLTGL
jgi:hypothetical protein